MQVCRKASRGRRGPLPPPGGPATPPAAPAGGGAGGGRAGQWAGSAFLLLFPFPLEVRDSATPRLGRGHRPGIRERGGGPRVPKSPPPPGAGGREGAPRSLQTPAFPQRLGERRTGRVPGPSAERRTQRPGSPRAARSRWRTGPGRAGSGGSQRAPEAGGAQGWRRRLEGELDPDEEEEEEEEEAELQDGTARRAPPPRPRTRGPQGHPGAARMPGRGRRRGCRPACHSCTTPSTCASSGPW
jgi:hypothetical protein